MAPPTSRALTIPGGAGRPPRGPRSRDEDETSFRRGALARTRLGQAGSWSHSRRNKALYRSRRTSSLAHRRARRRSRACRGSSWGRPAGMAFQDNHRGWRSRVRSILRAHMSHSPMSASASPVEISSLVALTEFSRLVKRTFVAAQLMQTPTRSGVSAPNSSSAASEIISTSGYLQATAILCAEPGPRKRRLCYCTGLIGAPHPTSRGRWCAPGGGDRGRGRP